MFLRSAILFCAVSTGYAQVELPETDDPAHGVFILEHASVEPGGSVWVGLRISMQPKWHVYWANPGDSGLAPSIDWKLPKGVTASPIHWPAPHRIPTDPLMTYGYDDVVVLLVEMRVSKDFAGDSIHIGAEGRWLVCSDVCQDGSRKQTIDVPVRKGGVRKATAWAPEFAKARAALPKPAPAGALRADAKGLRIDLAKLPIAAEAKVYFFPAKSGWIDHAAPQPMTRAAGRATLALPRTEPNSDLNQNRNVSGVLIIQEPEGRRAFHVDLPLTKPKK